MHPSEKIYRPKCPSFVDDFDETTGFGGNLTRDEKGGKYDTPNGRKAANVTRE